MPSAANGWAGQPPPTWQQGYGPQGKILSRTNYCTHFSRLSAEAGHEEAHADKGGAPYSTGLRLVTRSLLKVVWSSVVCLGPGQVHVWDLGLQGCVSVLALVGWGGLLKSGSLRFFQAGQDNLVGFETLMVSK